MDRQLIDYLPPVLHEVKEYKEIMTVEQVEVADLWSEIEKALNNQFVEDADINGVLRFEKILDITPKAADTLSDRKFRILTRYNEQLPYTFKAMEEKLVKLCGENGFSIELLNDTYTLKVRVELVVKSQFDSVESLVKRISPANLVLDVSLKYNQYGDYTDYTHTQLGTYTHEEIRSEVIS